MGEQQKPVGPESGYHFEAGESNAENAGGQHVPTVREATIADQVHNGLIGANDETYVAGEMVRATILEDMPRTEVVPGGVVVERGEMGKTPERSHSTQEDIVVHHAEDVAMHDAEVRKNAPPIIVVD
jgi:hypothetical protein